MVTVHGSSVSNCFSPINADQSFSRSLSIYRNEYASEGHQSADRSPPQSGRDEEQALRKIESGANDIIEGLKRFEAVKPHAYGREVQAMLESGQYLHRGVRYASASEAAVAELMERYLPGFKIVPGETYQVLIKDPAKNTYKTVDFCVEGCLVEFHPLRLYRRKKIWGDFPTKQDKVQFLKQRRALRNPVERRRFVENTYKRLSWQYYSERRSAIDRDPVYRGRELIVAVTAGDLYDQVITRFGKGYPGREFFLAQFEDIRRQVFAENSRPACQGWGIRFGRPDQRGKWKRHAA